MKRLSCKVQHYQWGKRGQESAVGQLMNREIEEDEPYAELWMGTHPNGPSYIKAEGAMNEVTSEENLIRGRAMFLSEYIAQHPEMLGAHEGKDLQFLFKVLSVGKALSVQSHPNKEQAKVLYDNNGEHYPDTNHKPELAIALTDFELLCGFQKPRVILSNVRAHQELLELIGEDLLTELAHEHDATQREALKKIFTQIWTSDENDIKHRIQQILARIFQKDQRAPIDELMLRLSEQFPDDIGILAPLFLNHFTLKPGEATFITPNVPHTYLSGDCIECMASSDNTIRGGLTPKFKDVKTFCDNLIYQTWGPPIFKSKQLPDGIIEYAVGEFTVRKIDKNVAKIPSIDAASILIVISGEATLELPNIKSDVVQKSDILFLPQHFPIKLIRRDNDFLAFQAFTPPHNEK